MEVRVSVEGDLAITEVDQMFFNGASQTVEGVYTFRVPIGASLTRFGVDREGVIVWGRVKEKMAAAAQYASHVYEGSKEDPALLEWDSPGVYRARLYPIAAGATRRVVVRYTQWLGRTGSRGERRLYTFPMAAEGAEETLPHIEFFGATFDLGRAGAKEVRTGMQGVIEKDKVVIRAHDLVPRADLAVELFDDGAKGSQAYLAPHTVDFELVAPTDRAEARKRAIEEASYLAIPIRASDIPKQEGGLDLVMVVDSSAGMDNASMVVTRAAVHALLSHLGEQDRALLVAGDTTLRPVVRGWDKLRPVTEAVRKDASIGLATLERGGATDLGAMIAQAAASLDPARRGVLIYIGDGKPTVGELALVDLKERLAKLPRPVRTFGLGVGQDADMSIIEGLVEAGFAERLDDAADAARTALRLLEEAERPAWLGVNVDLGPAVERLVPRELKTLIADESVIVVGRLTGDPPKTIRITTPAGDNTLAISPQRLADFGDLQARWSTGRLRQLLADGVGRAALVDLGVRGGIITPYTSLYVPTTQEMSSDELEQLRKNQRNLDKNPRGALLPTEPESKYAWLNSLLLAGCQSKSEKTATMEAAPLAEVAPGDIPETVKLEQQQDYAEKKAEEGSGRRKSSTFAARGPTDSSGETAKVSALSEKDRGGAPSPPPQAQPAPLSTTTAEAVAGSAIQTGSDNDDKTADSMLGIMNIGAGGGGKGEGIGQGFGSGHGRLGGSHQSQSGKVKMDVADATGPLPRPVIERIFRQNYGAFRMCYETGLQSNPNLRGRINLRFDIGADGSLSNIRDADTGFPDAGVVSCVLRACERLSFPASSGPVAATYTITFSPPEGLVKPSQPLNIHQFIVNLNLPHQVVPCAQGSKLPLADRVALWRERLGNARGEPQAVASVYHQAINQCEASAWPERSRLLSMMLDALPTVEKRVALWRLMQAQRSVADSLYRGILSRIRKTDEMRQLHQALGLRSVDPGLLEELMKKEPNPAARAVMLRDLRLQWPDDSTLSLALLHALEDANDDSAARVLGRQLRNRPDADAHVLTEVGELYLRLAKRSASKELASEDEAEARRAFGEIVEYSPDEPVARRRLGDLLRSHGWFAEAARQYETLARLAPDETGVFLLQASAAQGLGKLDEAVRWAEKASNDGAPGGDAQGLARTARSLAAVFLAWGRVQAAAENRNDEFELLRQRTMRLLSQDDRSENTARAVLVWSHPELHPTLWSNALGSMMPAPEGDMTLGLSQVILPRRDGMVLEIRIEKRDLTNIARLGAQALLTVIFQEGKADEKVVRVPVVFNPEGPAALRFRVDGMEVKP
jgi:Ca-activated chloride channel family protein